MGGCVELSAAPIRGRSHGTTRACNSRKADRLLSELGLTLRFKPGPPRRGTGGVLVLTAEPHPTREPSWDVCRG